MYHAKSQKSSAWISSNVTWWKPRTWEWCLCFQNYENYQFGWFLAIFMFENIFFSHNFKYVPHQISDHKWWKPRTWEWCPCYPHLTLVTRWGYWNRSGPSVCPPVRTLHTTYLRNCRVKFIHIGMSRNDAHLLKNLNKLNLAKF